MSEHPDTSVAKFAAWLETKPDKATFSFGSNSDCCFAQYLKETGVAPTPWVGGWDWRIREFDRSNYDIPIVVQDALTAGMLNTRGRSTFGAVKEVLNKLLDAES